jgi:MFS family permease
MAVLFAVAIMEQTILAVALPSIGAHFHAADQSSWVVNAFLLGSAAFAPIFGRLSDVMGRKLVMQACTVMFLVFTAACAAAPSIYALIVFRALQGIGASGSVATGYVVLAE